MRVMTEHRAPPPSSAHRHLWCVFQQYGRMNGPVWDMLTLFWLMPALQLIITLCKQTIPHYISVSTQNTCNLPASPVDHYCNSAGFDRFHFVASCVLFKTDTKVVHFSVSESRDIYKMHHTLLPPKLTKCKCVSFLQNFICQLTFLCLVASNFTSQ